MEHENILGYTNHYSLQKAVWSGILLSDISADVCMCVCGADVIHCCYMKTVNSMVTANVWQVFRL